MENQNRFYQVFIGAPFSLHREREIAIRSIIATKNIPVSLDFVSPINRAKEGIGKAISNSDIYIAILGHRYGSGLKDENGREISFSEWEYKEAKSAGIYTIALLENWSEIEKKRNNIEAYSRESMNAVQLFKFYENLRNSCDFIKYWTEDNLAGLEDNIKYSILKASAELRRTQPERGYIRATIGKDEDALKGKEITGDARIVYASDNIPVGNSLLELKLISNKFVNDVSRKLFAINSLYNELCSLAGVSIVKFPLKIERIEVGSLWINIFGESKVITLCAKLISSAISYAYRNFTTEGKIVAIPEKIEVVESFLELSKKLRKEGENTEDLNKKINHSSMLIINELNNLLSNSTENDYPNITNEKMLLQKHKK